MDLQEYWRSLRLRWLTFTLIAGGTLLLAYLSALLTTPAYTAHAQFFLATPGRGSLDESYRGGLFAQERVRSYAELVTSEAVARAVIQRLDLADDPNALRARISTAIPPDTVLIDYSVKDPSPERARDIANAIGLELPRLVDTLEAAPGTSAALRLSTTETAVTPGQRSSPNLRVNLLLGLVGGCALGLLGVLIRDRLDPRLRDPEDVASVADIPVLGVVSWRRRDADMPLATSGEISEFAESFRHLREMFNAHSDEAGPRLVVIMPIRRGNGGTTTAANLAFAVARGGRKVVLVDADVAQPTLTRRLGMEGNDGLVEVLSGRQRAEEALWQCGDELRLAVLPAGERSLRPGEILHSEGLRLAIAPLVEVADVIVVDAPPVHDSAAGIALARLADAVVVVAGLGRCDAKHLAGTLATLKAADADVLGVVATRRRGLPGPRIKRRGPAEVITSTLAYQERVVRPAPRTSRKERTAAPRPTKRGARPARARGGDEESATSVGLATGVLEQAAAAPDAQGS